MYSYGLLYVPAPSPKGVECPFLGRYEISGGLNAEDVGKALAASRPGSENNQDKPTPCDPPGKQYLTVGCNSPDTMEFQSECGTKTVAGKRTPNPGIPLIDDPWASSLTVFRSVRSRGVLFYVVRGRNRATIIVKYLWPCTTLHLILSSTGTRVIRVRIHKFHSTVYYLRLILSKTCLSFYLVSRLVRGRLKHCLTFYLRNLRIFPFFPPLMSCPL